ncbi:MULTISPECIES: protein translocase subunit SecF [Prochlorococcus]|uniref:Protein translocase subunit SecF n=1 Tax=Prochlorococcus marinus str. MIT 9116 TaxID=167544 RepID=A0A0A1ZQ42_PROMR|nr:protein translocase subunit SecF [Prochlorococcus marinus]KGF89616.1 Protein-export membrane protein SecF [Prochlorococcus marinus str. MIT 9107]KGF90374.1 Protein-export membrane protein SecF [Prochlorococcus marinus str. MIT 9116]KGF92854.1 Protein-export membrane protein SecF [Prochlorococcus marinus str. MIT 9123]
MKLFNLELIKNKKKIIGFSTFLILFSLLGILYSTFNTSYKKPINLGMDFVGGNELRIERFCEESCSDISPDSVLENLREFSKNKNILNNVKLQFQNNNKLISIRTPYLSIEESNNLITNLDKIIGPLNYESKDSRLIGPKLGKRLLTNCVTSLLVSLFAISLYITIRFDRKYALFALLALFHDLLIVFGIFSWLGIILSVEVNSLFAVSLLTIAGYSVNDTVVIFDRIRENLKLKKEDYNDTIQLSVNESFRRTTFTSITTLIPLLTLILFGSYSLFWFSLSLSIGIIVGSYSSILLAPSFLLKD